MTTKTKAQDKPRSVAENVSLVVSLGLVIGLIVALVVMSVGDNGGPAKLKVRPVTTIEVGNTFQLEIDVINDGGTVAENVEIEGVLGDETATVTIDLVSAKSKASATLVFTSDPKDAELHVTGFRNP